MAQSRKCGRIPHISFSAFLLSFLCLHLQNLVAAQGTMLADIQFGTGNKDRAGDTEAVYKISVQVPTSGDLIRTYFPMSIVYQGDLEVCQETRLFGDPIPITDCTYDAATNMVEFMLPGHVVRGYFFYYEIGYWRNPAYSQRVSGFDIQVLDSSSSGTILYQKTDAFVDVSTGQLSDQSLQTNSEQVAAQSDFTFMFSVKNQVPQGGFIDISFPLAHFEVPKAEDLEIRQSVDGGATWWEPQGEEDQVEIYDSGIKFMVPESGIEADSIVVLEIKNMTNPNTMEATDSFNVTTLTAASERIDMASTGFVIQMQEPAEIAMQAFQVGPQEVGQLTWVTMTLMLPTVYEAEGYLTMTLPESVQISPNDFYCVYHIGFKSNDSSGGCTLVSNTSSKVIRIDKNIHAKQITFQVIALINPSHTKETDDFLFHIYDPMNNMIAQTPDRISERYQPVRYTPEPGPLESVDITRPDATVGFEADGESAAFKFTITTKNLLQSGEIIQFKIPFTQLILSDEGESIACLSRSQSSAQLMTVACTAILGEEQDADYFLLRYPVYCSQMCETQGTFELYVTAGIQNPTWITSRSQVKSIEVTSYTSDLMYKIDSRTSDVLADPSLEQGRISSMVFSKEPGLVGALTEFQFEMRTLNPIPVEGYLQIEFQDDALQLGESMLCEGQNGISEHPLTTVVHDSGLVMSFEILEPCGPGGGCPSSQELSFKVSGVRNPRSTKSIPNGFYVKTYTSEGFPIDEGYFEAHDLTDLLIEPAFFLDVQLVQPHKSQQDIVTGRLETNYELRVQLTNGLVASKGRLLIAFPEQVKIVAGTQQCTAYEESSMELLDCAVQADQEPQTVIVTHEDPGKNLLGDSIMIKLQNSVINPPSTQASDPFLIETELLDEYTNVYYKVDQTRAEDQISVTSNRPNVFDAVSVERSVEEVSIETGLKICLTPRNPIPANSQLTIVYPEDQAIISTGQQVYTARDSILQVLASQPQQAVIILPDAIEQLTEYCFDVTNGIENPGKTSPPQNSFELSVVTEVGYQIDETLTGVFAYPLLSAGPFLSASVESFGQLVGDTTSLEAKIQLKSPLPQGSEFFIKLPDSIFYQAPGNLQLECSVDHSTSTQCVNIETQDDAIGSFVSSLRLTSSKPHSADDHVTLQVRNLRNKFDTRSPSAKELQVLLQSYDDNSYTINTSTVAMTLPQLTPNSNAVVLSAQRSELRVQAETSVQLELVTKTRLLNSSQLRLHLSKFLFSLDKAPEDTHLTCQLNSETKLCSLIVDNDFEGQDYLIIQMEMNCSPALCSDNHIFSVTIDGLRNRQSTTRGAQPYQEIYFETFEPTGQFQVDYSGFMEFVDELTPGEITLRSDSITLSENQVGQMTDFDFVLDYEGLQTESGDSIQINFESPGQLFSASSSTAAVKANNMNYFEQMVLVDTNGFISSVQTPLPDTTDSVRITLHRVVNLSRVEALNSSFQIFLNCDQGGQIAQGTAQIVNLDILSPVVFQDVFVERKKQDLASATDIEVSIELDKIAILPGSVLELFIPKKQLDLVGNGKSGRCRLVSAVQSTWASCGVDRSTYPDHYYMQTNAIMEGKKGSKMKLAIVNVFANPSQVTFSNASITLNVKNQGYPIGETSSGARIFVFPPLSKEELDKVSVSQEGLITGQPTQLTLSFQLKNRVPENSIVILSLPEELLIYDEAQDMKCEARSGRDTSSIECDVTGQPESKTRPSYVTEIRLKPWTANVSSFLASGQQSEIILTDAINADFVKDRASSLKEIQISIVSQNGFVVAQDGIPESSLPNLTPASLLTASMTRDSIKVGESQVTYELEFETPTLLQSGAYALLSIPKNEIKLRNDDFDCEEAITKNNLDCRVVESREEYYDVQISDLCWYDYCRAGEQIVWHLSLSNSNTLIFEEETLPIALKLFTREGEPIQELSNLVMIGPPLEGNRISNFELERVNNRIGGIDFLKFYVPPLQVTIFTETNLILELPNGIAFYVGDEMVCTRELESGEKAELQCQGVEFSDGYGGKVLRSVRILSLCGQYHVCFENEPLIFEVQVRNPSTNQRPNALTYYKLILRQEIGLDLGSGQRLVELPEMLSNTVDISMSPLEQPQLDEPGECQKTGATCHLLLNVQTANTLGSEESGAYLEVKIPSDFLIKGTMCWARTQQTIELGCYIMSMDTISVRAPYSQVDDIKEAENMISVIIEKVRMPVSTEQVRNPIVQNMELLPTASSARVFSILDTNEDDPGFTQISTEASSFKSVEVLRQNNEIGQLSSLRLTVQALHLEALQVGSELMMEIQMPVSAGKLIREQCSTGYEEVIQDSCEVTSEGSTHNTLMVRNFNDFCPVNELSCRVYLWEYINSDYSIAEKHQARDAFKFTLFYLLEDGERALVHSETDSEIFATPILEPLKISVTEFAIAPESSKTAEEISISIGLESDRNDVFTSPYLLIQFSSGSYQPLFSFLLKPRAFINELETQFRTIETVDADLDTSITALYIDIPEQKTATGQKLTGKTIDVKFTGFKNPSYVDESNLSGQMQAIVLGNSFDRWQVRAEAEHLFDIDLSPAKFDSLSVFSTKPWPAEDTYLEIDFSMDNQITAEHAYKVEVELPDGFSIGKASALTCEHLFTSESLSCSKDGPSNRVIVELMSNRQTNSLVSFMAGNLRIGPITNPDQLVASEDVTIRVFQSTSSFKKVYIKDSASISVKQKAETCPSGCEECAVDGSCVACKKPSASPLLEVETSECHSICPQGSFQSGSRCIKCNSECSTCHSLDQCSSCFLEDDKVFVDGRCLSECPANTIPVYQTEAICVRAEEDESDEDDDEADEDEKDTAPVFEADWIVENVSPCNQENCQACGLSSEFCSKCEPGYTRSDGQCLTECNEGFFSTNGICFKCSPMCKTCSETANRCDSCHAAGDDFAFNKFMTKQRLCASVCPPGTFEETGGVCTECSTTCNTCGSSADQCTSCFHDKVSMLDLYLVESDSSCQESCPNFTEKDYLMHECNPITSQVFAPNSWPMIMLISAIFVPTILLGLSRLISGQADYPLELSAALFSMSESTVKAGLWVTLWQSSHVILFSTIGVSLLCSALLSVIFYESTFLPVREALDDKRASKGVDTSSRGQIWAMRVVRILAYLSSIHTMRLLSSAFCGIKALNIDFSAESPCFYLKRRVQANKAQIALTVVWTGAAISCMLITPQLTASAVGAAIASIPVSVVSLAHQAKLLCQDKGHSSGYRSLQTRD